MPRHDFDVFEATAIEVGAQQQGDLLGCEVGHQAEVDLGARDRGQDGLGTRAGVSGHDPADRAGRLEEMLLLELVPVQPAHEAGDPVDSQHALVVEGQTLQQRAVGRGGRAHRIHETVDRDLVGVVLQRRERPDQPPRRVRHDRREG